MGRYVEFIKSKHIRAGASGFDPRDINPLLFDWQREIVAWACRKGRAALFEDCGLGKTPQQLEWARQVVNHTGGNVLIVAPLAVGRQTVAEGGKFGIEVHQVRNQDQVRPGINITNYEMVEHFTPEHFAGVVLDESSILKAFMGTTKRLLISMFRGVPYRLACTATPAPNDHTELGNHSEFLGYLTLQEMQSRWFVNDGFDAGKYRLKGHAEDDFWRWVASWAVCISNPEDLGYDGSAFKLPPLSTITHVVQVDETAFDKGMLINVERLSATSLHHELRDTAKVRAEKVAELVNGGTEQAVIWCHTDYEADALMGCLKDAEEVRGSMTVDRKSRTLEGFSLGNVRVLVTKPKIAGWGLNWQHCNLMATVGPSYSFEMRYQAVRRCWRFGQIRPVFDHVVMTRREATVYNAATAKEERHNSMAEAIRKVGHDLTRMTGRNLSPYQPAQAIQLPRFLKGA
jgi:superfamily II DNA or RNA helicase